MRTVTRLKCFTMMLSRTRTRTRTEDGRLSAAPVRGRRPKFKLGNTEGHANHYLAVLALQKDLPGLRMEIKPNLKGEYVLIPRDDDSAARMCTLTEAQNARLVMLDTAGKRIKAVLQCYPLDLPLDAVRDHPAVVSAERLRAVRDKAPTRQVLVELLGAAPGGGTPCGITTRNPCVVTSASGITTCKAAAPIQ